MVMDEKSVIKREAVIIKKVHPKLNTIIHHNKELREKVEHHEPKSKICKWLHDEDKKEVNDEQN